jgi:hypothetical protein
MQLYRADIQVGHMPCRFPIGQNYWPKHEMQILRVRGYEILKEKGDDGLVELQE